MISSLERLEFRKTERDTIVLLSYQINKAFAVTKACTG